MFFLQKIETDIKDVIYLQICNTRTTTSEKQFLHKIINFCIGPLKVPCRSRTLRPLEDLQGMSPGRRVPDGCFRSQFSGLKHIYYSKIDANNGSFIPLKFSLTDLITQHLQENNILFYDL